MSCVWVGVSKCLPSAWLGSVKSCAVLTIGIAATLPIPRAEMPQNVHSVAAPSNSRRIKYVKETRRFVFWSTGGSITCQKEPQICIFVRAGRPSYKAKPLNRNEISHHRHTLGAKLEPLSRASFYSRHHR